MLRMMVLDKNDSWETHIEKVEEESKELVEAIKESNHAHMGEEAMDNIQVAIGVLYKLYQEGTDIQQIVRRHEKKLVGRGWNAKAVIKIQVNKR
jgi:phosphoribosyl-ATP pyrophosphohydrolase